MIGVASFSHIVAGVGEAAWLDVIGHYLVPTLIGNIIGGVTLVAAINHAQVVSGGKGADI